MKLITFDPSLDKITCVADVARPLRAGVRGVPCDRSPAVCGPGALSPVSALAVLASELCPAGLARKSHASPRSAGLVRGAARRRAA
eukprot:5276521-Prymnesium_polylepis.1